MATQSEIGRDWKTSRNYVHKCVHKRGCPTHSLEAARKWRDAYARRRAPTDPKQLQVLGENSKPRTLPVHRGKPPPIVDRNYLPPDPLEMALTSARRAEERVSVLLREAIEEGDDSKILSLLIACIKAGEGRFNAEKLCRAEIERRQNLISIKTAGALAAN
jgi:hypothetical protein